MAYKNKTPKVVVAALDIIAEALRYSSQSKTCMLAVLHHWNCPYHSACVFEHATRFSAGILAQRCFTQTA